MVEENRKIICKNSSKTFIGSETSVKKVDVNVDDSIKNHLRILKELNEIRERLSYLEKKNCESLDELDFEFSQGLDDEEFRMFSDLFCESDIPLDTAEMYDDNSGIYIHLDESISEYEIYKVREKMNQILKIINPDLEVVE